ncbi:response regulator [Halobacillus sp. Nhm2S1]|uniref:response regulator n=1 Tax=Halobacillus sp. Nhm2S1 TaxID=2866716 RepID=UPI001C72AB26|nr:response regulator [Halobacillus sp. Nhm2S1]MBX0356063.1 response regulator [Halobacillus sp. Nhm2S1]
MINALIIDDSSLVRSWLKKVLKVESIQVIAEAANGMEGIIEYKIHSPHLVILDFVLPKMNGLQILIQLKRINPDVRVIVCSSLGDAFTIDKFAKHGAYDFIQKPYFERLPTVITRLKTVMIE